MKQSPPKRYRLARSKAPGIDVLAYSELRRSEKYEVGRMLSLADDADLAQGARLQGGNLRPMHTQRRISPPVQRTLGDADTTSQRYE